MNNIFELAPEPYLPEMLPLKGLNDMLRTRWGFYFSANNKKGPAISDGATCVCRHYFFDPLSQSFIYEPHPRLRAISLGVILDCRSQVLAVTRFTLDIVAPSLLKNKPRYYSGALCLRLQIVSQEASP